MLLSLVISASLLALASAQCSFQNGDMSASWQVANGELIIEVSNKNMGNNQWMGIGFGESMENLEVVLFTVQNNKASMVTGITRGYQPPTLDNSPAVNRELIQYNSNTLTGRFSRPLTSSGPRNVDLSGCSTWNFVPGGNIEEGEIGYHHKGHFSAEFAAGGPVRPGGGIGKHFNRPTQVRVCPKDCGLRGFAQRNAAYDPLPVAAVYNNRQSSRFNGLSYGK